VITEGALDAIRVGEDGVAIFGTTLLEPQFSKLIDIPNIIVMLDEDANDKAVKIAQKFKRYNRVIKLVFLPEGDPSDYSREELRERIGEALLFNIRLEYQILGL
jgi:hypothetical protein